MDYHFKEIIKYFRGWCIVLFIQYEIHCRYQNINYSFAHYKRLLENEQFYRPGRQYKWDQLILDLQEYK